MEILPGNLAGYFINCTLYIDWFVVGSDCHLSCDWLCVFVSRSAIGLQTVTCPVIGCVCLYQGLLLAHRLSPVLCLAVCVCIKVCYWFTDCHLSCDWLCVFVSKSAIGSQTVTCPVIGRVCLYQGLLLAHSTLRLLRPECHLSSDWSAEPLHLQSSRAVCLLYADTVSTDSISSSSSSQPALSPDQHPTSHSTIASDFFTRSTLC